ncbi:MAG: hypothetical protein ACLPWS_21060 [Rhodomicrobium sp.]
MRKVHPLAWQAEPTDFATTHCMNCEAGWTREGEGARIVICLLDREPVLPSLTDCDRFLAREEAVEDHFNQMARNATRK